MLTLLIGNLTATIVLYVIALLVDAVLFAVWLKRALEYGKRASRGETFSLRRPAAQSQTRGIPAKH